MPSKDIYLYFEDILTSISHIESFLEGYSFEAYASDLEKRSAVERQLQILTEAAIRLGDAAETMVPEQPWKDIRGLGNWLRHAYDLVDSETVWKTVKENLPGLKTAVQRVLDEEDKGIRD